MDQNVEWLGFSLASQDSDENPGSCWEDNHLTQLLPHEAREATQAIAQCMFSSVLFF